jgi:hypothetical protein
MVNYTNCATVLWRRNMECEVTEEHEDGSATVVLSNIEPEMLGLLIQEGFIAILTREIEKMNKDKKIPALLKEKPE